MPAARWTAAALVVVTALGAGGCAAASKDSTKDFKGADRDVAVTLEDFQDAARKHDQEKICNNLLAASLVKQIEAHAAKGSCPTNLKRSLRDADTFDLTVKKVAISGTTATAAVRETGGQNDRTSSVTLVKEGTPARWRISTIGG
jgi:hypothetical protein